MSVEALGFVWKFSRQGGSKLLLLLKIADLANDEGRDCWAEVPYLAVKCRMSPRNGLYLLHELVRLGELVIEHNEADRTVTLPGGRKFRPKWFLHVRCVYAWQEYLAEGDAEKLANFASFDRALKTGRPRRKRAKFASFDGGETRNLAADNAKSSAPKREIQRDAYKEGSGTDPLAEVPPFPPAGGRRPRRLRAADERRAVANAALGAPWCPHQPLCSTIPSCRQRIIDDARRERAAGEKKH